MTTPIKATRGTITLGGIKLDVFQMLDGTYRYSQTGAFMSITDDGYDTNQAAKRYIERTTSKQAQFLIPEGFSSIEKVKIEGENQTFNTISPADVSNLWLLFALDGNPKAGRLLAALSQEALVPRADAAFGVQRSEEEYNDRIKFRLQVGKVSRRTLTDAIGGWLENPENDASENTKRFLYATCADPLNKIVLGHKSRIAKEILGVSPDSLLRDYLPLPALKELDAVERLATILIDEDNTHPLEAVKQAIVAVRAKHITID